jgi:hypothetical protein
MPIEVSVPLEPRLYYHICVGKLVKLPKKEKGILLLNISCIQGKPTVQPVASLKAINNF